jgi:hypothetical protein
MTTEEAMYSNITVGQLLRDILHKFMVEFASNGMSDEASKISHQAAVVEEAVMACKCKPQQERVHEKSMHLLAAAILMIKEGSPVIATDYIMYAIACMAEETDWRPTQERERETVEDAIKMFTANPQETPSEPITGIQ